MKAITLTVLFLIVTLSTAYAGTPYQFQQGPVTVWIMTTPALPAPDASQEPIYYFLVLVTSTDPATQWFAVSFQYEMSDGSVFSREFAIKRDALGFHATGVVTSPVEPVKLKKLTVSELRGIPLDFPL